MRIDNPWVYLFAGGLNTRWAEGELKELADIGGEPCVMRTARQARDRGGIVRCLTRPRDRRVASLFPEDGYNKGFYAVETQENRWKTEDLLEVYPENPRDIILLLGDVIYSKAAMASIFLHRYSITVFGNYSDILAVVIPHTLNHEFKDILQVVIRHAEENADSFSEGHLWNCYRVSVGKPPMPHFDPPRDCNVFRYIDDWTRDIDSVEDYETFCRDVIDAGLLDDMRATCPEGK